MCSASRSRVSQLGRGRDMLNKTHDLTSDQLVSLAQNRIGHYDIACPFCSPHRKRENRDKKVACVWYAGDFANLFCVHCEAKAWARAEDGRVIAPERLEGGFDTECHLRAEGKTWPETPVKRTRSRPASYPAASLGYRDREQPTWPGNRFPGRWGLYLRCPQFVAVLALSGPAPVPQWLPDHIAT